MILRFEHVQSTPADKWLVKHNLSTRTPIVDCYVRFEDFYIKVQPLKVRMIDLNILEITWARPRTGRVGVI